MRLLDDAHSALRRLTDTAVNLLKNIIEISIALPLRFQLKTVLVVLNYAKVRLGIIGQRIFVLYYKVNGEVCV